MSVIAGCDAAGVLKAAGYAFDASADEEFLRTRAYEKVYVVFDRDDHRTHANSIVPTASRSMCEKNDEG